jgi:vancomycin permeability regulator SanA
LISGEPDPQLRARLDRAIQLYQQTEFPLIVVCGATGADETDEAAVMGQYLMDNGVPGSAIVEDHRGATMEQAAQHVAAYMVEHGDESVLVLELYYRVTRMKLALRHAGISQFAQAHTGKLQGDDMGIIAREAVAIYDYYGRVYFYPVAKVAAQQMAAEAEKMKTQAANKMNSTNK